MKSLTLDVPQISCDHCKATIEGAVAALDGVESVNVSIEPRTVDLVFDEGAVDIDRIVRTIEDQGYEVARA